MTCKRQGFLAAPLQGKGRGFVHPLCSRNKVMLEITAFSNTTTSPRTCSSSYAGWFVFPLVVGEQQVVRSIGRGYVRLRPEAVIVKVGTGAVEGLAA